MLTKNECVIALFYLGIIREILDGSLERTDDCLSLLKMLDQCDTTFRKLMLEHFGKESVLVSEEIEKKKEEVLKKLEYMRNGN